MKHFKDWYKTRTFTADLGKCLRDETLMGIPGQVFADGSWIAHNIEPDGVWRGFYRTLVERSEYVSLNFERLASILWEQHAVYNSITIGRPRTRYHCKECGSTDVTQDAIARWNDQTDQWEISSFLDNIDCAECGGETRLVKVTCYLPEEK